MPVKKRETRSKTVGRSKSDPGALDFKRGYYLAVSNLVSMRGISSQTVELLRNYGPVDMRGIGAYDREVLAPVVKIIRQERSDADRF